MATDQGKTSNLTGLALMAELTAKTIPQTGTTTFRPPFTPVAIGALAGIIAARSSGRRGCRPRTAGRRSRARCSSRPAIGCARSGIRGPARATGWRASTARCATVRERRRRVRCLHARQDRPAGARMPPSSWTASTPTRWTTLAVGKARYGLMLREDGFVLDDGTTSRLGRAPLHRHHHHGQRRQGAAAHGVLPPVAVAGARRAVLLGQRAVGAVLRRRPALARRAAQGRRSASTTSPTRRSPTWRLPS